MRKLPRPGVRFGFLGPRIPARAAFVGFTRKYAKANKSLVFMNLDMTSQAVDNLVRLASAP